MFGNLINNNLIKELLKQKVLEITPMDNKLLQLAQYPLRPHIVHEVISENEGNQVHFFSEKNTRFSLKAKSYYWIDILETIKLPTGIVGRFIPSSNLIEKGLGLTAGKIEKPFGDKGEKIRFGLFNYLDTPVNLAFLDRLAYIQFMDLRGLDNHVYKQSKYEKTIYAYRLPDDDGPNYQLDNEEDDDE
jgi:deoxycytidine triphosphate deaminase